MSTATIRIVPKTTDRHRGVKYTLHVPTELDDRLANLKPEPMPRTRMVLIALKHYLDDCRAYGIDARTLLPRTPPRPHVPTPDEIMDKEDEHEHSRS